MELSTAISVQVNVKTPVVNQKQFFGAVLGAFSGKCRSWLRGSGIFRKTAFSGNALALSGNGLIK
jgi:hypothetical protein